MYYFCASAKRKVERGDVSTAIEILAAPAASDLSGLNIKLEILEAPRP